MNRIAIMACVSLILWTTPALSATSGVVRNGKIWLQPSIFTNLSYSDISKACPPPEGRCSGVLGSVDVTGHHWAGIASLYDLLQSYEDFVEPASVYGEEFGSNWAPEILSDFHPTGSNDTSEYVAIWVNDGWLAQLTDVKSPQGADYYELQKTTGAASAKIGALLWRYLRPVPVVEYLSITPSGNGRFNVFGSVRGIHGADACALVLASGRCAFSCGPDSSRCEGGKVELPKGRFALTNLPTEEDGSIALQVFLGGHLPYYKKLRKSTFSQVPIPEPTDTPTTYMGEGGGEGFSTSVSACFNLSADATRLVSLESECDGGSSLHFEAEIDFLDTFNDPGCSSSIRISLTEDIVVAGQSFTAIGSDGSKVTGYFDHNIYASGTIQDANGCRAEWTAIRGSFSPF